MLLDQSPFFVILYIYNVDYNKSEWPKCIIKSFTYNFLTVWTYVEQGLVKNRQGISNEYKKGGKNWAALKKYVTPLVC